MIVAAIVIGILSTIIALILLFLFRIRSNDEAQAFYKKEGEELVSKGWKQVELTREQMKDLQAGKPVTIQGFNEPLLKENYDDRKI
jgi:hypothetical protein